MQLGKLENESRINNVLLKKSCVKPLKILPTLDSMLQSRTRPIVLNVLIICLLSVFSCKTDSTKEEIIQEEPLSDIGFVSKGSLTALLGNDLTSYYVAKGQPRGFEYELLKWFCKDHDLELKTVVIKDYDHIIDSLVSGQGDLAAANLTITGPRLEHVAFTPAILKTKQVLVQRLPENLRRLTRKQREARLVMDALELDGKTVHLHQGSSYYKRLKNLAQENGLQVTLVEADPNYGPEKLIEMVSNGEIDYTIVDENVAKIHQNALDNLYIQTPVSLNQRIGWAVQKNAFGLQKMLSDWLEKNKRSKTFNIIYAKYYKHGGGTRTGYNRNYRSITKGQITDMDQMIKHYAETIDWDWRLLAALINKESKFNPYAESAFGAVGLMQVLPTTGQRFGVNPEELQMPERNLMAGTRFLAWLEKYWDRKLTDSTDRIKYILASYNAGLGHVIDARNLADKYGANPDKWEDVSFYLLKKTERKFYTDPIVKSGYCRGREPVNYVIKILEYYQLYQNFTESRKGIAYNPIYPPQDDVTAIISPI